MPRPRSSFPVRPVLLGIVGVLLCIGLYQVLFPPYRHVVPTGEWCGRGSSFPQYVPEDLGIYGGQRLRYRCEAPMTPTGIVLHYTVTPNFHRTMEVLETRGLYVHLVVDTDGKTYQIMDSLEERAAGAPGSNGWAIHIEIVGDEETLLADAQTNGPQTTEVIRLVHALSQHYRIPLVFSPEDPQVEVWRGVFSHQQIAELHPLGLDNGKVDPGEAYMEIVTKGILEQ